MENEGIRNGYPHFPFLSNFLFLAIFAPELEIPDFGCPNFLRGQKSRNKWFALVTYILHVNTPVL